MANLEALWVAGRLHPGKRVIGSKQAHYTHGRISEVLGIPFSSVPVTHDGRMDLAAIEALLQEGDIGTVVVTMGNTGLGAVDPLHEILQLREHYDFRIHADAAYGGYFGLASCLDDHTSEAYSSLNRRRFDCDRSTQAWLAAVRMWLCTFQRFIRWQVLQT